MAGGEDSRRRRTAKGVEAAATAPQATLGRCSTKRKAGKETASGLMPLPRASAAASASADAEKAAGGKKNLMPVREIRWILSQKPEVPPPRFQALKRRNPELVPRPGEEDDEKLRRLYSVTRTFYEAQERLPQLQAWVRGELKSKGYVEVDDEWVKRKVEAQAMIDREWPRIRAKMEELCLMDEPCLKEGGDASESDDSDDEDGEDEDAALASVMKDYNLC